MECQWAANTILHNIALISEAQHTRPRPSKGRDIIAMARLDDATHACTRNSLLRPNTQQKWTSLNNCIGPFDHNCILTYFARSHRSSIVGQFPLTDVELVSTFCKIASLASSLNCHLWLSCRRLTLNCKVPHNNASQIYSSRVHTHDTF